MIGLRGSQSGWQRLAVAPSAYAYRKVVLTRRARLLEGLGTRWGAGGNDDAHDVIRHEVGACITHVGEGDAISPGSLAHHISVA